MQFDMLNASFELIGALLLWMNVYTLHKEKEVKGVFWPTILFFFSWGVWNLFYYPSLNQWYSFAAGILLASGNGVWVTQIVYYKYFYKQSEDVADVKISNQ